MKTSYNSGLVNFLLSTDAESIYKCDMIGIALSQIAQSIYATDGQMALDYLTRTYEPQKYGVWKITSVSTKLGMMNATCEFSLYADPGVMFPGLNLTMMQAIEAGLFEGATLTVQTAYMTTYGVMQSDGSGNVGTKYQGQISSFKSVGMTAAQGKAEPYSYAMNQQMPRMVLQPACRWQLYGAGCGITSSSFSGSFTVNANGTGGTFLYVPASSMTQAAGYFSQGVLQFTGGQNSGLSYGIKAHTQATVSGVLYGVLQLDRPALLPIAPGDIFTAQAGCDHTYQTCLKKFNNTINFGGTPYIPDYTTVI